MSRLSFRPRPLDIHRKLPIVKSTKDLDNDEAAVAPRPFLLGQHIVGKIESNAGHPSSDRRRRRDIPIPQYTPVESYERDYTCCFVQPPSYLRRKGARNDSSDFVEYDLDNEDEDWLQQLNSEWKILVDERFEWMLYKLELLDHKVRERAGGMPATFGVPVPVMLPLQTAIEALRFEVPKSSVLVEVYEYWKAKRERFQKPILRGLQPPPPVNDTNPFNVFRPREKAHRPHIRRTHRRENDVNSFEKLRQIHRNLQQARELMRVLRKREEKKLEHLECEANLQRVQVTCKVSGINSIEPVMLFRRPIDPERLSSAGIIPPRVPPVVNGSMQPSYSYRGRIGRGGRIIFDRWNPLIHTPIGYNIFSGFSRSSASRLSRPPTNLNLDKTNLSVLISGSHPETLESAVNKNRRIS